jgi:hypothetical protein
MNYIKEYYNFNYAYNDGKTLILSKNIDLMKFREIHDNQTAGQSAHILNYNNYSNNFSNRGNFIFNTLTGKVENLI